MSSKTEADIINECMLVIKRNRNKYIPNISIVDEIDNYYDNYKDIQDSLENKFISYVKNKIATDLHAKNRYSIYGIKELEFLFEDEEFKSTLNDIRNLTNLEYYLYLTNKTNKDKIEKLEFKLNYLTLIFVIITIVNVFYHISIN